MDLRPAFRPPAHERAISCKTLTSFLQSLVRERVTIELKDDRRVSGVLVHVDAYMNCQMTDVTIKTPKTFLSEDLTEESVSDFLVTGTRVRYVTFDDSINPMARIKDQLANGQREHELRIASARSIKRPKSRWQDPRLRNNNPDHNQQASTADSRTAGPSSQ